MAEPPTRSDPTLSWKRTAVILAAGRGTRMRSATPKVLHQAAGRPLLAWVLAAARASGCTRLLVVIGHGADAIRRQISGDDIVWVEQREQRGTGHALAQVEPFLDAATTLLVLSGDVPLVSPLTLEQLAQAAASGWGAAAVADVAQPGALGRVIAQPSGAAPWPRLERIVEAADATPEELAVRQVNAGIYALPAPAIFPYLHRLEPHNVQGEYYLTTALSHAAREHEVALVPLADPQEASGINDRRELAQVHRILNLRLLEDLMRQGVTVIDPHSTQVEPDVCVGPDTILHPGVSLQGNTQIGAGCTLHQGVWVRDSLLADGVEIAPYSVLDGARVGQDCHVGPFARLRPASVLLPRARVGNFVELKKTQLGAGAKVNHLTYLGDAQVGEEANIGAGVVTCNYDGVKKHATEIGDRAFVGSDTMLVAPVKVGARATTGAGSVITQDVPDEALGIGRARQKNVPAWYERRRRQSPAKTPPSDPSA